MKIILQRTNSAMLEVNGKLFSKIKNGLLLYVGFKEGDYDIKFDKIVQKIINMRIFRDGNDKMNLSVKDIDGEIMVVSNFTLYADCTRGHRPNFMHAMNSLDALANYNTFVQKLEEVLPGKIKTGCFGEHMHIIVENDGPINIVLENENI